MPTLRDYVTETEQWADTPREGDDLDIEIAPDELAEGRVIESDGKRIVIEISESAVTALEQRGMLSERIGRYGAVGSSRGMGFTVAEQKLEPVPAADSDPIDEDYMSRMLELAGIAKPVEETAPIQPNPNAARTDPLAAKAADLAPVGTEQDPTTATTVDEGMMSEIDIDLQSLANRGDEEDLIAALEGDLGPGTAIVLKNMLEDLKDELASKGMTDVIRDDDKMIEILWDKIVDEYSGRDLDEAEYQGRKVPLGKPMRGGSKKFFVYVKDPKSGNVRKVSFGDPNMKIKKSNPARRKSFRARHNCDNPGPRTKARYWSCRAW
jgi:hypothetical protein